MTDEQKAAHLRMMRSLPVRTISAAGLVRPEEKPSVEEKDRPVIVHVRYKTMKSAASTQRVQVQTIREWIRTGRACFADE